MKGFFTPKQMGYHHYDFIKVGKSPFLALALALIDTILPSNKLNEPSLKKIIDQIYHYFPHYIPTQSYLTLNDRVALFIRDQRTTQIVVDLAYVLQQLTISRLLEDPVNLNYRPIFRDLSADLPQEYLRQQTNILPYNILCAAAIEFNLRIILHETETRKDIRKGHQYTGVAEQLKLPEVSIFIQNGCYFHILKNKLFGTYSEKISTCISKPIIPSPSEETLESTLELIAIDDKQLLLSYKQLHKSISSMINASELNKDQLITLYCEFLPEKEDTTLIFLQSQQVNHLHSVDNQIEKQLIDFLAAGVATHNIDSESFLDRLEHFGSRQAPRVRVSSG